MSDMKAPDANMSASRIRKVVVVGRDEALWLASNILLTSFHRTGLEIVAVELPSRLRAVDVTPTLRNQQAFHGILRLKEAPVMALTQGVYTLGQRFSDFSKRLPGFVQGYGSDGQAINRVPFHHYWVKARASGLKAAYDDFSLNAVAARQGRFFKPDADTDTFAECDYAYHFEALPYNRILKQLVLERGISHVAAPALGQVSRDADTGHITAITLSDGQAVDGDLFVDATGAESLLLGGVMEAEFESWQSWLPCDRILTASAPPRTPLPSFSQVSAFRSGWAGQYPLRQRTAVRLVFRGTELNDQQALQSASAVTFMPFAPDAAVTGFTAGRRRVAWSGNCVGIGEAAAVFDPIDNVGMQGILTGLSHLTSLLPLDGNMALERKEYNLNVQSAYERIRDFQICHYKLNQRDGDPFWDQCRATELPDSLAYKLRLFEARGHLVEYDDETFLDHDWRTMLLGHGLIPRAYDPVVDQVPDGEVMQRFQQMFGFIKNRVVAMKTMEAFMAQEAAQPVA